MTRLPNADVTLLEPAADPFPLLAGLFPILAIVLLLAAVWAALRIEGERW